MNEPGRDVTILEAKELKSKLENQIRILLMEFSATTGMMIDSIYINETNKTYGGSTAAYQVEAEIKMR